jgi:hypothetical protein
MQTRPEKRATFKERLDKNKHKLDDREKHMGKVVKEKKAVADVSHKLRFPTTEGAAQIKSVLQKTAESIHKEFGKQRQKLEGIVDKCKKDESDFKKRAETALQDAFHAKRAEGQIRETKNAKPLLAHAEKVSKADAGFVNELRRKLEKYRQKSLKNRNALNAQFMNTRLKLNW